MTAEKLPPIWIKTIEGDVPITRYKKNEYFAWYKTSEGTFDISHIATGLLMASVAKQENAEQLANSLAVLGDVWNKSQDEITKDSDLMSKSQAMIMYWTR